MSEIIEDALKRIEQEKRRKRPSKEYLLKYWEMVGKSFSPRYKRDELADKYINYFSSERYNFFSELRSNSQKGLRVYGPKGLGKTLNFLIYQRICRIAGFDFFWHYEIKEIEHRYKMDGEKFLDKLINHPELAISDIGIEEPTMKNYGTKIDLIDDILSLRYIKFQNQGFITHITTNITNAMYHENYGDRHDDRADEMFINIKAEGESKRPVNLQQKVEFNG